jgi:hypothetical protein
MGALPREHALIQELTMSTYELPQPPRLRTLAELYRLNNQLTATLYVYAREAIELQSRRKRLAYQGITDIQAIRQYWIDYYRNKYLAGDIQYVRDAGDMIKLLIGGGWYVGPDEHGQPHEPAPNAPEWAYITDLPPLDDSEPPETSLCSTQPFMCLYPLETCRCGTHPPYTDLSDTG